jgi:NtrC-family two-component system response regulator AlgB
MSERGKVLVIDDEPNILRTLTLGLEAIGFAVTGFSDPVRALEEADVTPFDLAFIDLMMQPIDGMEVLRELRRRSPGTTAVIITAHGSIDSAVEAMKNGAFDFLQKPFDLMELQLFAGKVLDHHKLTKEVRALREQLKGQASGVNILTRNALMRRQLELAAQVADSPLTVLIEGESGTGKELVAQYIHQQSARRGGPFVKVNCAALAEGLLESELFGHVKGAFTGAVKDRDGRFQAADGGVIFLDEIGDIASSTQVKLLRFLQHREFERVGENTTRKVDARVIAATNRILADALKEGSFREDLFYRLNAVKLTLPPLRDRPEDVLLLMHHFLKKFSGSADTEISPEAVTLLTTYRWPGNVRELENVIERAALLAKGCRIELSHLPPELQRANEGSAGLLSLEEMEQRHIAKILQVAKDFDEASRLLGIDSTTLWRKRKKYGL